jgi:hypothetical protein
MISTAPWPRIRKFTPFRNPAGTIRGFFNVELPSGLIVNDWKLMLGPGGKRWIALPSVKALDAAGHPILARGGKAIWNQLVEFRDRAVRERFEQQILAALRQSQPGEFDQGGPP